MEQILALESTSPGDDSQARLDTGGSRLKHESQSGTALSVYQEPFDSTTDSYVR